MATNRPISCSTSPAVGRSAGAARRQERTSARSALQVSPAHSRALVPSGLRWLLMASSRRPRSRTLSSRVGAGPGPANLPSTEHSERSARTTRRSVTTTAEDGKPPSTIPWRWHRLSALASRQPRWRLTSTCSGGAAGSPDRVRRRSLSRCAVSSSCATASGRVVAIHGTRASRPSPSSVGALRPPRRVSAVASMIRDVRPYGGAVGGAARIDTVRPSASSAR